jgi:DNA/RNA-binding domain of Phe-tRNA-synthetase-like protein
MEGSAARVEVPIEDGRVASALRREFPGLALRYAVVAARPRRSPQGVRQRLKYLSNRMHGRRALNMRTEPIASAYRVFFRHIGLDPDEARTPIEAIVLERMRYGGFRSHGLVDDALTIAIAETGVAMRALDADSVTGQLALRISQPRERLGGEDDGIELPSDTLVLADDARALGLIFGETAPAAEADKGTRRIAVVATQVDGVPDISVEEAIWICADALSGAVAS